MVGAEAELAAGLQLGCDQAHRPVVHHPPLGMARLGPGIGVEQVDERQGVVGHPFQHFERIAHVQSDIDQSGVANMGQRLRHPVEERLTTNEAVIGQKVGPRGKMLATTKADLEMERTGLTK